MLRDNADLYGPEGRCARITVLHESVLFTFVALEVFGRLIEDIQAQAYRPVAIAYVILPLLRGSVHMVPHFARQFAKGKLPWQAFERNADAVAWVRGLLNAAP